MKLLSGEMERLLSDTDCLVKKLEKGDENQRSACND